MAISSGSSESTGEADFSHRFSEKVEAAIEGLLMFVACYGQTYLLILLHPFKAAKRLVVYTMPNGKADKNQPYILPLTFFFVSYLLHAVFLFGVEFHQLFSQVQDYTPANFAKALPILVRNLSFHYGSGEDFFKRIAWSLPLVAILMLSSAVSAWAMAAGRTQNRRIKQNLQAFCYGFGYFWNSIALWVALVFLLLLFGNMQLPLFNSDLPLFSRVQELITIGIKPVTFVESVLILAIICIAFFGLPVLGLCFVFVALQEIYGDLATAPKTRWLHTLRLILAALVFCIAAMMALWVEHRVLILEGVAA